MVNVLNTTSRNIIGRNPFMVIPLLANQDLTPMLSMWLPVSHGEIPKYLSISKGPTLSLLIVLFMDFLKFIFPSI